MADDGGLQFGLNHISGCKGVLLVWYFTEEQPKHTQPRYQRLLSWQLKSATRSFKLSRQKTLGSRLKHTYKLLNEAIIYGLDCTTWLCILSSWKVTYFGLRSKEDNQLVANILQNYVKLNDVKFDNVKL